jgi:CubicO group peptidase (beta-lactamase class C family)
MRPPPAFDRAREVIVAGLGSRAYPAAAIEVGSADGPIWSEAFGRLTYAPSAPTCDLDTIFDLASLTKVIVTASLAMQAHAQGRLPIGTPIADRLSAWRGDDRRGVLVRHLLDHSSGLPAHVRLWEHARGRAAIEAAMSATALDHAPGTTSVYSDLGVMLLGFLLEDAGGAPLDVQFGPLARALGADLFYRPPVELRDRIAPTEIDPERGGVLQGEVHDENAAALGGVAAHAGLFGAVGSVGVFARAVQATAKRDTPLGSPEMLALFSTRTGVPDSSRALGWDTMRPTSSCGTRMSAAAIGHTGFTGTSLWIDPARDVYVAFLTNRVHPTRQNNQLMTLRPALHDAVNEAIDTSRR